MENSSIPKSSILVCSQCGGRNSLYQRNCQWCGSVLDRSDHSEQATEELVRGMTQVTTGTDALARKKTGLVWSEISGYKVSFGRLAVWLFFFPFVLVWKIIKVAAAVGKRTSGQHKNAQSLYDQIEEALVYLEKKYSDDRSVCSELQDRRADLQTAWQGWKKRRIRGVILSISIILVPVLLYLVLSVIVLYVL